MIKHYRTLKSEIPFYNLKLKEVFGIYVNRFEDYAEGLDTLKSIMLDLVLFQAGKEKAKSYIEGIGMQFDEGLYNFIEKQVYSVYESIKR